MLQLKVNKNCLLIILEIMYSQNSPQKYLKLSQFISIACQLSLCACSIIKQGSQNSKLGKYLKGHDDPVTEADYHVQTMIIEGLRKFFPSLKVIGQETVDYQGQINVDYSCFKDNQFPQNSKFKDLTVPYDQICVWIDPIDCTKGFIEGRMDYVTNLIGMSRNNQAYIGVMGVPYKLIEGSPQYRPYVVIGVSETQEAFTFTEETKWVQFYAQPTHQPYIITNSKGRVCERFKYLVQELKCQIVYAQGSGRKILMVINGEVDLFAYLKSANMKWDTCAGQAIVRALGGEYYTLQGERMKYDPNAATYHNPVGQICSLNKELVDQVFQILNKQNK